MRRNRKNFNEANPSHDYICKFSQIVIQRLDLNPKEGVMALFLSARTGTGYTLSIIKAKLMITCVFEKWCHHYPFNSFTFSENYHLRLRKPETGCLLNGHNHA